MAAVEMYLSPTSQGKFIYEYEINLTGVGNSDWVLIPAGIAFVQVTLSVASGGVGKVQATTDTVATVKTGSPVAVDWDYGEVSANTIDTADPPTGIRLVQTGVGITKLTLRAQ